MAAVDPRDQSIVIRIVYDGPPEAGKTTSMRALARGFGRELYTPEEQNGRTVYFDWLEHVGGRFDGAPIRCEIVSVPGQRRWQRRRNHFVDHADAIVFVADTSASCWSSSLARLRLLLARLRQRDGAAVGVVFQANRRDLPDAVPIAVVREDIAADNVAVIESIATDGTGIREAFVFAVRLALDRVREEQRLGRLPIAGEIDPRALLADLQALEAGAEPEPELEPTPAAATRAGAAPRTPSHQLPSGFVWPPVEGRIVLREATRADAQVELDAEGDYRAELSSGWRAHSSASATFDDVERARAELVAWARRHAAMQPFLSRQRCIALAETGDGHWRLWQVVRDEPSLRAMLDERPHELARWLGTSLRVIGEARTAWPDNALPCSIDTLGVSEIGGPRYVGLVPAPGASDPEADDERAMREIAALVRARSSPALDEVRRALRLSRAEPGSPDARSRDLLLELLAS